MDERPDIPLRSLSITLDRDAVVALGRLAQDLRDIIVMGANHHAASR
jgi:hypothetical protein